MPPLHMPHIPIPLISHLTDNEEGIVDAPECPSGPTQGVTQNCTNLSPFFTQIIINSLISVMKSLKEITPFRL